MKKIILLGANGSIGTQTLDLIKDKEYNKILEIAETNE